MFSYLSLKTLLQASFFKNTPIYVQFYITARCNLTCRQCNIIYANADVRECTLDEIYRIADHLAKLGVAMVLLTGGEPFVREDLAGIIKAFEERGIHVRMQTNGFASEEAIQKVVACGGRDISISLDTLDPDKQDWINGDFHKSWQRAVRTMSLFTKYLPRESSFASLGCVLQRLNLNDIEDVIRFGTRIGWFTSLVPVHATAQSHPMNFRTFDPSLGFRQEDYPLVDKVIEQVRRMRRRGYYLYDSDQYLDDIKRFVRNEPVTWRRKHGGACDSPNLYFAILPNGYFAPCCDHRLGSGIPVYGDDFVKTYRSRRFREDVSKLVRACPGCMYGSFPEMTIAMRFMAATIDRFKLFLAAPPEKKWPLEYEDMLAVAEKIRRERKEQAGTR